MGGRGGGEGGGGGACNKHYRLLVSRGHIPSHKRGSGNFCCSQLLLHLLTVIRLPNCLGKADKAAAAAGSFTAAYT